MVVTRESIINQVTNEFAKWVDYTEKAKYSDLTGRSYDNPGNYSEHAGKNNYTVFADLYKEKTGISVQGQPWCDTFVDTIFIHLYGVALAEKALGGFSAYTPTSAGYFRNIGTYSETPSVGSIIFFRNSTRIYHTGYVYAVDSNYVYTIEGNTSAGDNVVVENGGAVAKKKYSISNSKIDGYGIPLYDLIVEEKSNFPEGWMLAADNARWWYQFKDGSYAMDNGKNNGWYIIDDHYYAFDINGYMLTGYQVINNEGYLLATKQMSDIAPEGALLITNYNYNNSLQPWVDGESFLTTSINDPNNGWIKEPTGWRFKIDGMYVKPKDDSGLISINGRLYLFTSSGYLKTGYQNIDGNWYYFSENGLLNTYENTYMATRPFTLNNYEDKITSIKYL